MKKEALLAKIEPLFFDKTYKEISLQDIADVFGIKKASLYYYFESKDDLFLNLINYSYKNYILFLEDSIDNDIEKFIEDFIFYPSNSKNFFSVITQNGYCGNLALRKEIANKKREVFVFMETKLDKKYSFSKEQTFLFLSLMEDIGRKKCLSGKCPVDMKNLIKEIAVLFSK